MGTRRTALALPLVLLTLLGGCAPKAGGGGPSAPSERPHESDAAVPTDGATTEDFDYEDYLGVLRSASGIDDPPETEFVRLISPDELPDVWSTCMESAGFAVSVTFDGGLQAPVDMPSDQGPAFERANYTCFAQYPVDQRLVPQFGAQQVDILYAYYRDELVPCLERRGYSVSEIPTLAVFRDTFDSDQWTPYSSVAAESLTDAEWESLATECPQEPTADVLYPDGE